MVRKLRERIQSEEKGFTLIELLVVILIIGILAAIALPAFLSQQEKAEDGEAKVERSSVRSRIIKVGGASPDREVPPRCPRERGRLQQRHLVRPQGHLTRYEAGLRARLVASQSRRGRASSAAALLSISLP